MSNQNSDIEDKNKDELRAIILFEEPIKLCLKIREYTKRRIFYSNGTHLFNFVSLVTMMYKLNITSLIYSVMYILILN